MKNFQTMRYLRPFIFFLLSCLAFSCSKTEYEPILTVSEVQVLHASYVGGRATKTEFGQFTSSGSYAQIYWSEGDAINLFYQDATSSAAISSRYETQCNGATADFKCTSTAEASGSSFIGLYPYSDNATADFTSSTIITSIPDAQTAKAGVYDPAALLAVGISTTMDNMSFYNVCCGLCFTLKESGTYSSIVFRGNSQEQIAGPVSISLKQASDPQSTPLSGASTSVVLTPAEGSTTFDSGVEYYIMLRPQDFQSGFSLDFYSANQQFVRTCTCSSFVSFKRGVFARVSEVDRPEKLAAIRDGSSLAADGETANCYIISSPGSYKFPLAKGNDSDYIFSSIDHVSVLWETDNTSGTQTKGSIISSATANGKFVFLKTPDVLKNGNAVIAAYRASGEIVWSWHIWVLDGYDPSSSAETLYGKSLPMMDRNIGALASSPSDPLSNGMFYQWGRKDPFPGAVERYVSSTSGGTFMTTTAGTVKTVAATSSTTVDYTIANPYVYLTATDGNWLLGSNVDNTLWANDKTVYDPCPPGWKVPRAYYFSGGRVYSAEAWTDVPYERVASSYYGYGVYLSRQGSSERAWYPANGYVTQTGALYMVGQYACYWSCSPYGGMAYTMQISQDMSGNLLYNPCQYGKIRVEGHSVRCIQDK